MANFDTLKAQIAALIPDNTEQEITAKDVRDAFGDTIDAINAAKEDEGAIAPAQWGGITGDLDDQTDLKNALDAKQGTISDLAAIRSGAAAGATAYQKPGTGIPKADLASGVQESLGLADTALQWTPSGEVNPDITPADYATREELDQLEQETGNISNSLIAQTSVGGFSVYYDGRYRCVRDDGVDDVAFTWASGITRFVQLKKGQTIRFSLSAVTPNGSGYNYYIWFALPAKFTAADDTVMALIDGLDYNTWSIDQPGTFEYSATQDCYFNISTGGSVTITAQIITYDGGIERQVRGLTQVNADGIVRTTAPSGPGVINNDGTLGNSSANYLYFVPVNGISKASFRTGVEGASLIWATYDGNGTVKRLGPTDKVLAVAARDNIYLDNYEVTIQPGEEILVIASGVNVASNLGLELVTAGTISEQIDTHGDDVVFAGNITANENIYMWAGRVLNSGQLRKDINDHKIFDLDALGGSYGNPSDCTFSYDADNFYFAGTYANSGYNDILGGVGCEVRLYIVPKAGTSYTYKTIVSDGATITDKHGVTHTIQRGGSMPNLVKVGGVFHILFSTMINNEFVEMRCTYDPATDTVADYCICLLSNGEKLSTAGLSSLGYELYSQSPRFKASTINMNAYCQDAYDGTYYYIGACLANLYEYPFVLKTADFENFTVYKQLIQKDCHAAFECSTAILDGVLYTATRSLQRGAKLYYLLLNSMDLATGEMLSTTFVRDGGSRPQLFKSTDGYIFLSHAMDAPRQSGRIMKVSGLNGHLDFLADYLQFVQYAEFVANGEDNTNTYYMFVFNRIYKVQIDKYTRLPNNPNMNTGPAYSFIDKLMELYEQ